MNSEKVKQLADEVISLIAMVPERYQEASFQVIFAKFISQGAEGEQKLSHGTPRNKPPSYKTRKELIEIILKTPLDFSKYVEIIDDGTWLDKAIVTLTVIENELGFDSLTPQEIAEVMKKQMRTKNVYSSNLSRDLSEATSLFNRSAEGRGYKYYLTRLQYFS